MQQHLNIFLDQLRNYDIPGIIYNSPLLLPKLHNFSSHNKPGDQWKIPVSNLNKCIYDLDCIFHPVRKGDMSERELHIPGFTCAFHCSDVCQKTSEGIIIFINQTEWIWMFFWDGRPTNSCSDRVKNSPQIYLFCDSDGNIKIHLSISFTFIVSVPGETPNTILLRKLLGYILIPVQFDMSESPVLYIWLTTLYFVFTEPRLEGKFVFTK